MMSPELLSLQAIKGESMLTRFEEVKEGLETSLRRIAVLVSQELNSQVRAPRDHCIVDKEMMVSVTRAHDQSW